MKGKHPILCLLVFLLLCYTAQSSYVRLPSGDDVCNGSPSSIEWFRTGRDFCQKDKTFWECQPGGVISKFQCDSSTCDGDCAEVPVHEVCVGLTTISCLPTFDFSHTERLPGTVVHYKNGQCSDEGQIIKIHQKLNCEEQTQNSCTKEEDEDLSFREFCGGDFRPDSLDYDEEFHIVGQFASSATQRAQLVLVGFVVVDLLLCYVMMN
eukprot:TRINITY_DN12406_c0_g1_i1.p1 TRINITY_DN12406_c0_g1~~TRINITY_DN12406_c0_g1_i1.p1  ORF type:complete len:208 (+),score=38.47 TRINITY_DN12406_c0_g1_i1:15-638(+)